MCRLQELLDEHGIKLFPGDRSQLLMVLRMGNSDPEVAVEVAKKYIAFSRYVLDSKKQSKMLPVLVPTLLRKLQTFLGCM